MTAMDSVNNYSIPMKKVYLDTVFVLSRWTLQFNIVVVFLTISLYLDKVVCFYYVFGLHKLLRMAKNVGSVRGRAYLGSIPIMR